MNLQNTKFYTFILALICLIQIDKCEAQKNSEFENSGKQAFAEGDFFSAAYYFTESMAKEGGGLPIYYQLAESYRLSNAYTNAALAYQKVHQLDTAGIFPEAVFWEGRMLKCAAKYDSAKVCFSNYLMNKKTVELKFKKRAEMEILACKLSSTLLRLDTHITITRLGNEINTPFSEFRALQSGDSMLYFSSLQQLTSNDYGSLFESVFLTKIKTSALTPSGFSKSEIWKSVINDSKLHVANLTIGPGGNIILFTRCKSEENGKLKCDIYLSEKHNSSWSSPTKIEAINLKGYTSTQPNLTLTTEGDTLLYFVSDRPGGFGGNDIWYSVFKNQQFNTPVNAGNQINTEEDEITPFYMTSKALLYFSSEGHPGLGGFDVFSAKGGLNSWETPINLGVPINSSCNDLYFTANQGDTDGYITSNRPGSLFIKGETCCNDIYSWELNTKKSIKIDSNKTSTVNIVDSIKSLLPLTLFFHNDEPDPNSTAITTNETYSQTNQKYLFLEPQYLKEYAAGLKDEQKKEAENSITAFFKDSIRGTYTHLQLFFNLLEKDLTSGSKITVTIKGYTSPLNNAQYNFYLSKRRINSLVNEIKSYKNGLFIPYMEKRDTLSAFLEIREEPYGKSKARPGISDDRNDQRNSVYSPLASSERKIQILYYESNAGIDSDIKNLTEVAFDSASYSIGKLVEGDKKLLQVRVTNIGRYPLELGQAESDKDNVSIEFSSKTLRPGASGYMYILYTAGTQIGKTETYITLKTNASPRPVLTITAEIVTKIIEKKTQMKPLKEKGRK